MKRRKVIFSALTGNYDHILQPIVFSQDFDYILFSNDIEEKQIGVWQIRQIPYNHNDNVRIARWVKTHPHILLPDYEYCVWIDSNVKIASEKAYAIFEDLYKDNALIASFAHPERNCIYEEGLAVILFNRDTIEKVIPEMLYLKRQDYPKNNGLFETNCIFFRADKPQIQEACNQWWQCIEKFSRRDQLSFNYVLWKYQIKARYLLPKNFSSRNHPFFECQDHALSASIVEIKWKDYLMGKANIPFSAAYWELINTTKKTKEEQRALYKFLFQEHNALWGFTFRHINAYIETQKEKEKKIQEQKDADIQFMRQELERRDTSYNQKISSLTENHHKISRKNSKHLHQVRILIFLLTISLITIFFLLSLR